MSRLLPKVKRDYRFVYKYDSDETSFYKLAVGLRNAKGVNGDSIYYKAQNRDKSFEKGALLHSDQGFQYTTKSYEKQVKELGIQGSHSRRGNCHDKACIESFYSHLKTEKLYLVRPKTLKPISLWRQKGISFPL